MPDVTDLFDPNPRIRLIRQGSVEPASGCVLYWMQRSQRGRDNPALNLAIDVANKLHCPVVTIFCLTPDVPGAQERHYRFLLEGLEETASDLAARGVPLILRLGKPQEVVAAFAHEVNAALVVGDENPLRFAAAWRTELGDSLKIPFACVDADVVVPSALFPREEYAARTIRPKIHKFWCDHLIAIPNPKAKFTWNHKTLPEGQPIDPDALIKALKVKGISPVPGYRGGPREAARRLRRFIDERINRYATDRNLPATYMTSELSAHLHFGQISPVTIALAVSDSGADNASTESFVEELIVRRELAVNFVARNPNYDTLAGCPDWALATLAKHQRDKRPYLYSAKTLESGETKDLIWNAAQKEMTLTGRMHNYLRMYWAKKILEWTPDAETAFSIAAELNDKYEMDGRNANGYTGVAWAIGGKHDRPWPERPIFGTIRYMNAEGLRRKFDTEAYIARVRSVERGGSGSLIQKDLF